MELPLDHFRLIGVSPSATSEEILRAFQLRLDKSPDEGFTFEVLTQRSELLRLTADLLTNNESRKEYENLLLNGASGLEFPSSREVAGLILLWEAGSPKEAFKLARKALQPPQTPALGSSREADLTLLAALTSRDAAIQEEDKRCYVNASDFLQEGIQILQRMGKLVDLRKDLEDDLMSLLPYRILDYLNREISDFESHKKGLNMLENFIIRRGGLEGKNKSEYDQLLSQDEFEAFFQQIKAFLTVQEQIDLYLNLQSKGSDEAGYLAFIALTAEGFTRRKPEKLIEAKRILKNLNLISFDSRPLSGCLDLLLADVQQAETEFLNSTDEKLKEWLNEYRDNRLQAICLYCKNWLENEVLKGYRDIEIKDVDLDSWFENREIQEFIENFEKKSTQSIAKANLARFGKNIRNFLEEDLNSDKSIENDTREESNLPLPGGFKKPMMYSSEEKISADELFKINYIESYKYILEKYAEFKFLIGDLIKNNSFLNKSALFFYFYTFLALFVCGIGVGAWRNNLKNKSDIKIPLNSINQDDKINKKIAEVNSFQNSNIQADSKLNDFADKNSNTQIMGIETTSPSLIQVKELINAWLKNKSYLLSGKGEVNLSKIVKQNLIKRLNEERSNDIKNKIYKNIQTEIQAIDFLTQSSSRITVLVEMQYSEQIFKEDGELVSETNFNPNLKVKYILGFSDESWKLVDYVSGV